MTENTGVDFQLLREKRRYRSKTIKGGEVMNKQQAIKAANRLQRQKPSSGPYFVVYDDTYRRYIVCSEDDYDRECAIDYNETQAQTVHCTW